MGHYPFITFLIKKTSFLSFVYEFPIFDLTVWFSSNKIDENKENANISKTKYGVAETINPIPILKFSCNIIPNKIPGSEAVSIVFEKYRNCIGIRDNIIISKGTFTPLWTINDHTFLYL